MPQNEKNNELTESLSAGQWWPKNKSTASVYDAPKRTDRRWFNGLLL